jgi:predicted RNA binding protein YcfA (HicA-like mRNA interferase family)
VSRLPSITPDQLVVALQRAGLQIVREGANHTVLWKEGLPRPVPVPRHARELKRNLLLKIIREAGLTQEEFRRFLR